MRDSTSDFWSIVPTASALRVHITVINALLRSTRIFKRDSMYSDAQHEMKAYQTLSTVWFDTKVAGLSLSRDQRNVILPSCQSTYDT